MAFPIVTTTSAPKHFAIKLTVFASSYFVFLNNKFKNLSMSFETGAIYLKRY